MARVLNTEFAATIGFSSSTYTADPTNFEDTLETALTAHDIVFIKGVPGNSTYTLGDTYYIPSGKSIIGDPNSRPTLFMTTGTNKTVISNANASSGGITTDVVLRNLIIDQNYSTQSGGGGIVVTGVQDWTIHNVRVKKVYRFGFLSLHQSTGVANNTGTVTLTNGSASVTGSGTLFTTELAVGDIIKSAGAAFGRVSVITDNTHLTLTMAWGTTTETGVTYKTIEPNSGCTISNTVFEGTVDNDCAGFGLFDSGTITGCESYGAGNAVTAGCSFVPDHARSVTMTNLVAHDSVANSGISLETSEDCTITNCTAYSNSLSGVQLISGSSRCTVTGCKAYSNTNGFRANYNTTSRGVPTGNVFTSCTGFLNSSYGFRNDGAASTEFASVTARDNDTGGLISNTANSVVPNAINVHNSIFTDDRGASKSQDRGIWIVTSTNGSVTNNTALDSEHTVAGIVNDAGAGCTLSGNTT